MVKEYEAGDAGSKEEGQNVKENSQRGKQIPVITVEPTVQRFLHESEAFGSSF